LSASVFGRLRGKRTAIFITSAVLFSLSMNTIIIMMMMMMMMIIIIIISQTL
jgi:hypothetical protein